MTFAERRLADAIAGLPETEKLFATLTLYERLTQDEATSWLALASADAEQLAASVRERLADVLPAPDREVRALQKQAIVRLAAPHLSHLNTKRQFATARESVVATVPDAELEAALDDVRRGDGGELRVPKAGGCPDFHSSRSSCALAVSSFGPWRLRPETLKVGEHSGFDRLRFEVKFPITDSRFDTPPNLDVVSWAEGHAVAIESKLVEYIAPKHTANIGSKYDEQIAESHPSWRAKVSVLRDSPDEYRFFNAAQIIKHYLGLKRDKPDLPEDRIGDRTVTLLYLYWEPLGEDASHPVYREHRAEVADFANGLSDPDVSFQSQSYPTIWADWTYQPQPVASHAQALQARYFVAEAESYSNHRRFISRRVREVSEPPAWSPF